MATTVSRLTSSPESSPSSPESSHNYHHGDIHHKNPGHLKHNVFQKISLAKSVQRRLETLDDSGWQDFWDLKMLLMLLSISPYLSDKYKNIFTLHRNQISPISGSRTHLALHLPLPVRKHITLLPIKLFRDLLLAHTPTCQPSPPPPPRPSPCPCSSGSRSPLPLPWFLCGQTDHPDTRIESTLHATNQYILEMTAFTGMKCHTFTSKETAILSTYKWSDRIPATIPATKVYGVFYPKKRYSIQRQGILS